MERLKVKDFLWYVGGNTKVIIADDFNPDNRHYELWRGRVEDVDWDDVPCGNKYIEYISVVNGEDWLQILI